jgi:hypothetical protein
MGRKKLGPKISCETCSKEFFVRPSRENTRFCSKRCFHDNKQPSSIRVRKVDNLAFKRYGSKCLICGQDRAIDFAHIVPARLGGNCHPDNILALCPTCHRLFDRDLLTEKEEDIIIDRSIYAWGSKHTVKNPFPMDDYLFSEEGQKKISAYPLEFLLNLPYDVKWDLKNARPFRVSLEESSSLPEHVKHDEEPQDA